MLVDFFIDLTYFLRGFSVPSRDSIIPKPSGPLMVINDTRTGIELVSLQE
jgi:hypothetical protein